MSVAEANLALALVTWGMVVVISVSHYLESGLTSKTWLVGVALLVMSTLLVLTAIPSVFRGVDIELLRIVAGFLRGAALVLVTSYAWYRWSRIT